MKPARRTTRAAPIMGGRPAEDGSRRLSGRGASLTRKVATIDAAALDWTIRVQHPEFSAFDALSAWLAADPRHAECFHWLTRWDHEIASALRGAPPRLLAPSLTQTSP